MATLAAAPSRSTALHVVLWIAQSLLAAAFLFGGAMKLGGDLAAMAAQQPWVARIPEALVRFIGLAEMAGGVGLLLPSILRIAPKLTGLAALGLLAIMVLAAGHHLQHGEMIVPNLVLGSVAAFVAWGRLRGAPIAPR